jgi:hypothetical protein
MTRRLQIGNVWEGRNSLIYAIERNLGGRDSYCCQLAVLLRAEIEVNSPTIKFREICLRGRSCRDYP